MSGQEFFYIDLAANELDCDVLYTLGFSGVNKVQKGGWTIGCSNTNGQDTISNGQGGVPGGLECLFN